MIWIELVWNQDYQTKSKGVIREQLEIRVNLDGIGWESELSNKIKGSNQVVIGG